MCIRDSIASLADIFYLLYFHALKSCFLDTPPENPAMLDFYFVGIRIANLFRNYLCFYKKANFNKPFLEKGSFSGFTFDLSKSGGLFEWK